jgi:hypothetical protein
MGKGGMGKGGDGEGEHGEWSRGDGEGGHEEGGMGKGVGVWDVEVGHGKGSICKLGGVLGVWGTFLEHL